MSETLRRPSGLTTRDAWIAASFSVTAAGLYIRTLAPGLLPGDSAEFQVLATLQASAHTTGYSIYLILARLVTLLPLGDAAYRANLLSALMGGVSAGLIYLLGAMAARSRWGGAVGALTFAIGGTVWSQAVIAEIYTSASAFLAGVLLLLVCWLRMRRAAFLFWAGLLGGLSLGVHGSVLLAAPAVLILLVSGRADLHRDLPMATGGALLGLALMSGAYAIQDHNQSTYNIFQVTYIPSSSAWDTTAARLDSLPERFWFNLSAKQWRPAMFQNPPEVIPRNAGALGEALLRDYAYPVLGLFALGLVALFFVDWRIGLLVLAGFVTHLAYTLNYAIGDIYVFFVPGAVYLAIAVAGGVGLIVNGLSRLPGWAGKWAPGLAASGLIIAAVWPLAGSRLAFLRVGEAWFDFSGMPRAAQAAQWKQMITATVKELEPGSIVYMGWGDLYASMYVAFIDLGRSDLRFIELMPYSKKGGMALSMIQFIRANRGKHPQYFQHVIDRLAQVGLYVDERQLGPMTLYRLRDP